MHCCSGGVAVVSTDISTAMTAIAGFTCSAAKTSNLTNSNTKVSVKTNVTKVQAT